MILKQLFFFFFFFFFSGVGQIQGIGTPPSYSTDLETTLRKAIYTNYEVLQRPASTVQVHVQLNLITINYLVSILLTVKEKYSQPSLQR